VVTKSTDPKLTVGQKVVSIMGEMGRDFDSSYSEYVLLPNDQIYPIKTNLTWREMATIPETYYTAYGSLLNLHLQKGNRILARGATSDVGIAFLKLVKAVDPNAYVAGTSRSLEKKDLFFDDVILDTDNILQTDESFDRILELIGPASLRDSFKHTKENGIVCLTGLLGNIWTIGDFDPITELPINGALTSFNSANVSQTKLQALFDYIEKYHMTIKPEKVFSLNEVPQAHRYLESKKSFGKVIVLNEEVS
jgi:NADPH:quinone reductase-like Zn-dependent oxidoreductase